MSHLAQLTIPERVKDLTAQASTAQALARKIYHSEPTTHDERHAAMRGLIQLSTYLEAEAQREWEGVQS